MLDPGPQISVQTWSEAMGLVEPKNGHNPGGDECIPGW